MNENLVRRKARVLEEQQAVQKAKQAERQRLIQDYNSTFNTPEGKRVLRHMMRICGYQKPSVIINPQTGEANVQSTVYNEARRAVYLEVRDLVKPSILRDVETDFDEF